MKKQVIVAVALAVMTPALGAQSFFSQERMVELGFRTAEKIQANKASKAARAGATPAAKYIGIAQKENTPFNLAEIDWSQTGREGHMMALGNLIHSSKKKLDETGTKLAAAKERAESQADSKQAEKISPEKKALIDNLIANGGKDLSKLVQMIKSNFISTNAEGVYIIREVVKKFAATSARQPVCNIANALMAKFTNGTETYKEAKATAKSCK